MVYIMADYYTQALEIWFRYVVLVRSNQEGLDSGENFCVIRTKKSSILFFCQKLCEASLVFWCEENG
jgi:hypothetical protein